jgi:predicted enzyme related to lactoylglutathione lyase
MSEKRIPGPIVKSEAILAVADVAAASKFYREQLGFTKDSCQAEGGFAMAEKGRRTVRQPAMKFPNLRKKMEQNKVRAKVGRKK